MRGVRGHQVRTWLCIQRGRVSSVGSLGVAWGHSWVGESIRTRLSRWRRVAGQLRAFPGRRASWRLLGPGLRVEPGARCRSRLGQQPQVPAPLGRPPAALNPSPPWRTRGLHRLHPAGFPYSGPTMEDMQVCCTCLSACLRRPGSPWSPWNTLS